jgi:hypothetical protein
MTKRRILVTLMGERLGWRPWSERGKGRRDRLGSRGCSTVGPCQARTDRGPAAREIRSTPRAPENWVAVAGWRTVARFGVRASAAAWASSLARIPAACARQTSRHRWSSSVVRAAVMARVSAPENIDLPLYPEAARQGFPVLGDEPG